MAHSNDWYLRWLAQFLRDQWNGVFGQPQDADFILNNGAGAELRLRADKGGVISDRQIEKALEKAVEYGWTTLYVYKSDRKTPAPEMIARMRIIAERMGLGDQLHICDDPDRYSVRGSIGQQKRQWNSDHPGMRWKYDVL